MDGEDTREDEQKKLFEDDFINHSEGKTTEIREKNFNPQHKTCCCRGRCPSS